MKALIVITLIIWLVSAVGLVIFVLLHSGKGTGLSDMLSASMYSNTGGTSIVEKNLDRISIIFGVLFIVSLLVLMLIYPTSPII